MTRDHFPPGINRELGRPGFLVDVRVRPYPLRRRRFTADTPLAVMVAWRAAQRAELLAQRADGTPPVPRVKALDLVALVDRAVVALERMADALEGGTR